MDFARISAILFLFWTSVHLVVCKTDQRDVIKYLKRIERRLSRLESSHRFKNKNGAVGDKPGISKVARKYSVGERDAELFESLQNIDDGDVEKFVNHRDGLTNLLEEWNEFGYLTGGDVQDLKMTEEEEEEEGGGGEGEEEEEEVEQQQQQQEMKLVTRKRRGVDLALANRGSHGAAYVMSKSKSMARFMKGNLKRLSNTLSALQNKLTAASAMLERIEKKHIQSFQQQLDRLQRAFDPNLGEQEPLDKAGFWTIDILDMPQVVRFYCKKKAGISKDFSRKCAHGVFDRDAIGEAISCCSEMQASDVMSVPVITVSQTRSPPPNVEVKLTCNVNKSETPVRITWGREVDGILYTFETNDGVMTIENFQKEDSGTYTCKASNVIGISTARIFVEYEADWCEAITIPMCKDVGYNVTSFPNYLGHEKLEDAGLEVHQFFPLVKVVCSPDLKPFLCSMYVPMCIESGQHIPPCRSLCLRAKNGCVILLNKFGFSWPNSLNCSHLPAASDSQICLNTTVDERDSSKMNGAEKAVARKIPNIIQCQKIEISFCMDVGYNYTFMPNLVGSQSQEEAKMLLNMFMPFIQMGCSPDLKFLVCNVYAPMCTRDTYMPVCRSVCERARSGCEKLMNKFGFDWPDDLDCDRLPSDLHSGLCIDRNDIDVHDSQGNGQIL